MLERSLALALCAGISGATATASPYRGDLPLWWPRERIRIVYACPEGYVCFPARKDDARHVNTGIVPRFVPTETFRAADITPFQQAQQVQRKSKSSKR